MSKFLVEGKTTLTAYVPGEQPQDMKYLKLNTNESPFPPSKKAIKRAKKTAKKLQLYPDPEVKKLVKLLAKTYDVGEENVLTTNGSDEALNFIFMAFCDTQKPVIFPDITYGFYPVFAQLNGVPYKEIKLDDNFCINTDDYLNVDANIFIANPNAPTGIALSLAEIENIVKSNSNNIVVIDEAYVDFGCETAIPLTKKYDNLIVVQTFSKSRSMAGARLGFCIASKEIIDDLRTIKYSVNPYNVNSMTYAAGVGVLSDATYTETNCKKIKHAREYAIDELESLGFYVLPSRANFIFCQHPKINGETLYEELKKRGVLIRYFRKERIINFNRVTIGTLEQMQKYIKTVKEILEIYDEKC